MLKIANNLENLGTESVFQVMVRAEELTRAGHEVINLSLGQPDFKTADHIVEAGIKALRDGAHGYTLGKGILELREAVAADLHRRHEGVDVSPHNIIITPGGKVVMFLCITLFAEKGAEIIYPNPSFPIYKSLIDYYGARAVAFPILEENGFSFKADDILSRITDKTSLIILNTPANPTGGITEKDEMDKLAEGLEKHPKVAILSDEIYSNFLYDNYEHHSMLRYPHLKDRVIMLDGWSKTYAMTGWRLGFGVWPQSLVDRAERLCVNIHSCVNAAAQWAGKAALEESQDHVKNMLKIFDRRRHLLTDSLNNLPHITAQLPLGGFYSFPNVKSLGRSSSDIQKSLLEECHIATVAGTSFGEYGEGYIRLSYANSEENIEKAILRIQNWLNKN